MSIQTRLLLWLLPALTLFIAIISYVSYINIAAVITSPNSAVALAGRLDDLLLVIALIAAIMIMLVTSMVFFLSSKISHPVKQLKKAALTIAAGEYGESVAVDGPMEIVELANTLNTMSQCLEEQINRLKENSYANERLYGEYECAQLLQDRMLQRSLEGFSNTRLRAKLLRSNSCQEPLPMFLNIAEEGDKVAIHLLEGREKGFAGTYDLLQHSLDADSNLPSLTLTCDFAAMKAGAVSKNMPGPLLWKAKEQQFQPVESAYVNIGRDDMVFLFNQFFNKQFPSSETMENWFGKVLRHFSEEGFDAVTAMLGSEVNFLTSKHYTENDIYLLCLRVDL